jgi:hypothetical protein
MAIFFAFRVGRVGILRGLLVANWSIEDTFLHGRHKALPRRNYGFVRVNRSATGRVKKEERKKQNTKIKVL